MEHSDVSARRRLIEEITDRWIGKNKEAVTAFAASVKEMRQGRPYENQGHIYKATIPGELMRQLEFAVSSGDVRLFDPEGELGWFCARYPEFTIPYDRSTLER